MWKDFMIRHYGHPGAEKDLERLAYQLSVLGGIALFAGILFPPLWIFSVAGMLGGYMLQQGYSRPIPSSPPCKALRNIWGQRLPIVLTEAETFTADFFPFRFGLTIVNVTKNNHDFTLKGIRCRLETKEDNTVPAAGQPDPRLASKKRPHSGGALTVKGSWTFGPDGSSGERLIEFLNSGGEEGVIDQMEDIFGNAVRGVATERTWEEVTFLETVLAAAIAIRTTDASILKLPRDTDGKLLPQDQWPRDIAYREAAEHGDTIDDPVDYVDDLSIDAEERSRRQKEIDWFLKQALVDGVADVHGVGSQITRISVTEIEPEGKLKDDAEATAREFQQQTRDMKDTETGIKVAEQFMDLATKHGQVLPVQDAVRFAQTDRKRATQTYVTTDSDNPIVKAASVVNAGGRT